MSCECSWQNLLPCWEACLPLPVGSEKWDVGCGTFLPTSKEVTERPECLAHRQQVWLTSLQAPGLTQAVGRRVGSWAFTGLSGTDSTVCMGGWGGGRVGRRHTWVRKDICPHQIWTFCHYCWIKQTKILNPPNFTQGRITYRERSGG